MPERLACDRVRSHDGVAISVEEDDFPGGGEHTAASCSGAGLSQLPGDVAGPNVDRTPTAFPLRHSV
jgi:hypothetical protein